MAMALGEAGADLAIIDIDPDTLADTAEECGFLGVRVLSEVCDVSDSRQVREAFARIHAELGGPDILVNSAGTSRPCAITELTDEAWHRAVEVNLSGTFYCCREAGRYMLEAGAGKVINISSSAGTRGRVNQVAYASSKTGVIGLTKALGVEWAEKGIQVNSIAPGRFKTPLTAPRIADAAASEAYLRSVPMRRYGDVLEIRALALYLASPQSDFMTGQVIHLDGGSSAV
jgi:NAD(P)-dependent dehydrogenase (short-subunit alcohol dehydrogenase family)